MSGVFLLLIAAVNLSVLVGIVRAFRRGARAGALGEAELARHATVGGPDEPRSSAASRGR